MCEYVAPQVVTLIIQKIITNCANLLVPGITCLDVSNNKILDEPAVADYSINVNIYYSLVNPSEVTHEYKLEISTALPKQKFDAIIVGLAHKEFTSLILVSSQKENSMAYDVK